jgi:hypothetical protein
MLSWRARRGLVVGLSALVVATALPLLASPASAQPSDTEVAAPPVGGAFDSKPMVTASSPIKTTTPVPAPRVQHPEPAVVEGGHRDSTAAWRKFSCPTAAT